MVAYATEKALQASVSPVVVLSVIKCESAWNIRALGVIGLFRGLVQLYEDYQPSISISQAYDPRFAIDFLVSELKEGRGYQWTCARKLGYATVSE